MDALISKLTSLDYVSSKVGTSPGFDTVNSVLAWRDVENFSSYETYDLATGLGDRVPTPSPEIVVEYFRMIRQVWVQRLEWAEGKAAGSKGVEQFCSCVGKWDHYGGSVLAALANQVIEQLMTREASECLRSNVELCKIWNEELYSPETCPSPDKMKSLYLDGDVHLFPGFNEYFHSYITAALRAKRTIDICTCYLFRTEPSTRYILLDLLPYLARNHGLKVRVLFEAMTLESQILHSSFDDGSADRPDCLEEYAAFIANLPEGSPPFDRAAKEYLGASDLVRDFIEIATSTSIEVRYWMAREKRMRYRVKNHTKCNIFDGRTVIAGGSNLVPREGSRDTDLLMTGQVCSMYQLDFDSMWKAMGVESIAALEEEKKDVDWPLAELNESASPSELVVHDKQLFGHRSKVFFLSSQPSSIGEDVILRCVLGAINGAKESISICMGHFNIPLPVAKALSAATRRGVKVSILANSLCSCDLRGGQRDLFISLDHLLSIAPNIDLVSAFE